MVDLLTAPLLSPVACCCALRVQVRAAAIPIMHLRKTRAC